MLDGGQGLETAVRILLTLALLTLPPVASARTMFPREARALWRRQLLASSSLAAWHEETQLRPAPFPTRVKCRYVETTEHGKALIRGKALGPLRKWLAETVDHGDFDGSLMCDDAVLDLITLSTGEDAEHVRIQFDPSQRRLDAWDQLGNWETTHLRLLDVDSLLALLRAALPNDTHLYPRRFGCLPTPAGSFRLQMPQFMDTRPQVATMIAPHFPASSVAPGDSLVLYGLIDALGRLMEIRIKHSVAELDPYAIEAVEQWHFNPARNNGYATNAWVTIRIPVRE